jgi:hypothetical protein
MLSHWFISTVCWKHPVTTEILYRTWGTARVNYEANTIFYCLQMTFRYTFNRQR